MHAGVRTCSTSQSFLQGGAAPGVRLRLLLLQQLQLQLRLPAHRLRGSTKCSVSVGPPPSGGRNCSNRTSRSRVVAWLGPWLTSRMR